MSDEIVGGRTCPWCAAAAEDAATHCPACGAALAQRDSIAGVIIPGVTAVDPALVAIDGQPLRIPGPSLSQGMASGVVVAAATGGPVGLAVLGGLAALAAAEYAGAGRDRLGRPENLADVGRPSEVALRALDRIEHEERGDAPPDDSPNDPWRDDPGRDDAGRGAG